MQELRPQLSYSTCRAREAKDSCSSLQKRPCASLKQSSWSRGSRVRLKEKKGPKCVNYLQLLSLFCCSEQALDVPKLKRLVAGWYQRQLPQTTRGWDWRQTELKRGSRQLEIIWSLPFITAPISPSPQQLLIACSTLFAYPSLSLYSTTLTLPWRLLSLMYWNRCMSISWCIASATKTTLKLRYFWAKREVSRAQYSQASPQSLLYITMQKESYWECKVIPYLILNISYSLLSNNCSYGRQEESPSLTRIRFRFYRPFILLFYEKKAILLLWLGVLVLPRWQVLEQRSKLGISCLSEYCYQKAIFVCCSSWRRWVVETEALKDSLGGSQRQLQVLPLGVASRQED